MFDYAWQFTLSWEGGLCDDAGDPGGITKYGVDIRMLRGMNSTADRLALHGLGIVQPVTPNTIRSLTVTQAKGIYRYCVWERMGLTRFPDIVACPMFDAGVHSGVSRSTRWAQQACNLVGPGIGIQLVEDGKLGPKTTAAILRLCDEPHFDRALARAMIDLREDFLLNLRGMERFRAGFRNRINDLRKYLGLHK